MTTVFSEEHKEYMKRALHLAERGRGTVNPNPMVGAVLVKNNAIIGEGFHMIPGKDHAEIIALKKADTSPRGATLYVTMEPCNHHGKTPPCTEAIIKAGIRKVIIAARDPNLRVKGKGVEKLQAAGIEVKTGLFERESRALNKSFEKFVTAGIPFVSIKAAATFDGRIATKSGASKWITGERARKFVHELRRRSDAVLVGIGTVRADDPLLTVRDISWKGARPPIRVVLDSHLQISPDARVVSPAPKTLIFTTKDYDHDKMQELQYSGVEVIPVNSLAGRVDLHEVLIELGKRDVVDLLVEGGAAVNGSFIERSLVDYFYLFMAPKIFGGVASPSWVAGEGVEQPELCKKVQWEKIRKMGDDLLIEAHPLERKTCLQESLKK
jgi:diaminohydroxyphosphoribosylaminopyrimidine deaminase / 5-amino-6-(5-phosphoribosylamino)uracil reductase